MLCCETWSVIDSVVSPILLIRRIILPFSSVFFSVLLLLYIMHVRWGHWGVTHLNTSNLGVEGPTPLGILYDLLRSLNGSFQQMTNFIFKCLRKKLETMENSLKNLQTNLLKHIFNWGLFWYQIVPLHCLMGGSNFAFGFNNLNNISLKTRVIR